MRKAYAIVFASITAIVVATAPAMAATKNSGDQKNEEKQDSSSCHSYVQNPDGSWTAIPCQEVGVPTHTQHKSSSRGEDEPHH